MFQLEREEATMIPGVCLNAAWVFLFFFFLKQESSKPIVLINSVGKTGKQRGKGKEGHSLNPQFISTEVL